ncbi:hypothetical protein BDZ91DRAFT_498380 [Kalaharituber pfeilii]|nr:hypothetical protein BDZ91DRAFT_498380 [Kalaharituber pfeilii]
MPSVARFESHGLELLRFLEQQSRNHLQYNWDADTRSATSLDLFTVEAAQLKELLQYMDQVQEGITTLVWAEFAVLIMPFYKSWGVPAESKYLGPLDVLTKDVLAHLGRTLPEQYSYIRFLSLLPEAITRETECMEYLDRVLAHCAALGRLDLRSTRVTQSTYEQLLRVILNHLHIWETVQELALDLDFDAQTSGDDIGSSLTNPAVFFKEFQVALKKSTGPLTLKVGRLSCNQIPLIDSEKLMQIASLIPNQVTRIDFNFPVKNGKVIVKQFSHSLSTSSQLQEVAFGVVSWAKDSETLDTTVQVLLKQQGLQYVGRRLRFRLHTASGSFDDKPSLSLLHLANCQTACPEDFCRIAKATLQDSFGGVRLRLSLRKYDSNELSHADYPQVIQTLSKVPQDVRTVIVIQHSFNGHIWKCLGQAEGLINELTSRKSVQFVLSDLATPVRVTCIHGAKGTRLVPKRVGDQYPSRARGSFETFLEAVLPRLELLECLCISFDKLMMHRSRHLFSEVATVLTACLPQLCQQGSLRTLSLRFGAKAEFPKQITRECISGQIGFKDLEAYMEPHIEHCGFLSRLEGLTSLEINDLEIITPDQFQWLLNILPAIIPKTIQNLLIGSVRFCVTSIQHANSMTEAALLQLGLDGSNLGPVSSWLDWKGEFTLRIRRGMYASAREHGVENLAFVQIRISDVSFWGADEGAEVACSGRYMPPFSRQRNGNSHTYRGL